MSIYPSLTLKEDIMKNKFFAVLLGLLTLVGSVLLSGGEISAATRTVGSGGSSPNYSTIADAMSASSSGDTILVLPGTYNEDVVMKEGVILSGSGPAETTIQGTYSGSGVWPPAVLMAEGSMISGFTVTGGFRGISSRDCTCVIAGNVVTGNTHMGISLVADADNSIVNSLVINNTIADNIPVSAGEFSAGIYTEPQGENTHASPIIMNNIITGHKFGISPYFATPVLSYNNIWGNWLENYGYSSSPGLNDISEDPQYTDSDYHLADTSPCVDAGHPGPEYIDSDGSINDMGAYGGIAGPVYGQGFHSGTGFLFTSVGNIPTSEITQDSGPVKGLANVPAKVAALLRIPAYKDSPFGGDLRLHGLFGESDGVAYYRILAGKWIGDFKPLVYTALSDPLVKVNYTVNTDSSVTRQYVNLGPKELGGKENLYQLTASGFWSHLDLRMIWNTRLWANGKYTLKVEAYDAFLNLIKLDANDLSSLILVVDNSPVDAEIHNVKYDPDSPFYNPSFDGEIQECGMIYLTDAQENLRFTITASHPTGYLKNYVLDAIYGKNHNAGVIKSASYPPPLYLPPVWNGVNEVEFNSSDASSLDPWQQCAYQFRLRVYARTTNGYHYIYSKEFSDHYYLDLKQCAADLDGDGDVDGDDLTKMAEEFGSSACSAGL